MNIYAFYAMFIVDLDNFDAEIRRVSRADIVY